MVRDVSGSLALRFIAMTMTTAEAQAFCTDLTKKSGSNFYYSFSFCQTSAERHVYGVRLCKAGGQRRR